MTKVLFTILSTHVEYIFKAWFHTIFCAYDRVFLFEVPGIGLNLLGIFSEELSCSFDSQEFCSWTHDPSGDFQWMLNRGKTKSPRTGPSFDHTSRSMLMLN